MFVFIDGSVMSNITPDNYSYTGRGMMIANGSVIDLTLSVGGANGIHAFYLIRASRQGSSWKFDGSKFSNDFLLFKTVEYTYTNITIAAGNNYQAVFPATITGYSYLAAFANGTGSTSILPRLTYAGGITFTNVGTTSLTVNISVVVLYQSKT